MSPALKTAFEQVYSAPYIVKMVLVELGDDSEQDCIVKLDYDGSFARSEIETKEPFDVLAGTNEAQKAMLDYLVEHNGDPRRALDEALRLAAKAWAVGMDMAEQGEDKSGETAEKRTIEPEKVLKEYLKVRHMEAAVMERNRPATGKFRLLDEKEIRAALKDL
jgi:proteasome alpha subunit